MLSGQWFGLCFYDGMDAGGTATTECPPNKGSEWKHEFNYRAVLDDLLARRVARTYKIDFVGTPHVIILGINNSLLTKKKRLYAIDNMIETGWRCGPEIYREIVRLIRES